MIILGKEVSEQTATEIERIFTHLPCQVDFKPLPLDNPFGWGRSNWLTKPKWTVLSVTELPQRYFEVNLLHELYHLCQIAEGFPQTAPKDFSEPLNQEQELLRNASRGLISVILDLDVCDRISAFGLDSNFFLDSRYKQAKESSFQVPPTVADVTVKLTIFLTGFILQNNIFQVNDILRRCEAQNPFVVYRAQELASMVKAYDHNTAMGCFECLVACYDYLNLWNWQYIEFRGTQFISSKQAKTFLSGSHHNF